MQKIYLFAVLLSFLAVAHSSLIRAPISKHPRHKTHFENHIRQLGVFSDSGSMAIQNYNNSLYTTVIKLGSDKQELTVALDTGSSIVWVTNNAVAFGIAGPYFNCTSSSTCTSHPNDPLSVFYETCAVYGYEIQDQLTLGDLTISNFTILGATSVEDMETANYSGLLGLGLGRNPSNSLPTVLETLKSNNLISIGMFSMYLGYNSNSNENATGELIFGGYDSKYAASKFQFINVKEGEVYWLTNMTNIGYGSSKNLSNETLPIIFESGTSVIVVAESIFENLNSSAAAQGIVLGYSYMTGLYMCNCSAKNILDDLTFYFEDVALSIPASHYILGEEASGCYLAVTSQEGETNEDNPMILGDPFLSYYYALYNADNYTVGLAKATPMSN